MFAEAGLPFNRQLARVPRSERALMLAELARDRGLHDALHPRLFDAYWSRGLDIGDREVLHEEGRAVGLEDGDIARALDEDAYRLRIAQQTQAAVTLGAGGVPAWVIDERVMIPGAQPREVFELVLKRLGHESSAD